MEGGPGAQMAEASAEGAVRTVAMETDEGSPMAHGSQTDDVGQLEDAACVLVDRDFTVKECIQFVEECPLRIQHMVQ